MGDICYLCGLDIISDRSMDHVPPRQFFAKRLRRKHNLDKLVTLSVHRGCNARYSKDEQYFVNSIIPLAVGSYSGKSLLQQIVADFKTDNNKKYLGLKVLNEFDKNPSGLILPGNLVIKRFEGSRISRILWKILRGLFLIEYKKYLPESIPRNSALDKRPTENFKYLSGCLEKGIYPGVFAYKFIKVSELNSFHYWAFLLWDALIAEMWFHDPDCNCNICKAGGMSNEW